MAAVPLRILIPANLSERVLLDTLRRRWAVSVAPRPRVERTYLDTVDWLAYRAGFALCVKRPAVGKNGTVLELESLPAATSVASADLPGQPAFAGDLPPSGPWDRVAKAIGERRLLARTTVSTTEKQLALLNSDAKTVARVLLERHRVHGQQGRPARTIRVATVQPLRGYERSAQAVASEIVAASGTAGTAPPLIVLAARAVGAADPDAQTGPAVDIDPEAPIGRAVGAVLRRLREQMTANEGGVLERLDIEFLHEYRVAARRARSILKEARGVLPEEAARAASADLAWLGTYTGPARDLDVYLEELARPAAAPDDELEPLRSYLQRRRDAAQASLIEVIGSARYAAMIRNWIALEAAASAGARRARGRPPAGETADRLITRAHRRVLKGGSRIDGSSPPEALHDLRKRAKELRYLLECFANLYPPTPRSRAVKELKALQDNLGEFQDCQVQAGELRAMAQAMFDEGTASPPTLMGMGRLAEALERREAAARAEFDARFARFSSEPARRVIEGLVGTVRSQTT